MTPRGAGDKPKDDGRTNAALIAAAPALLSLIAARDAEIAALKVERDAYRELSISRWDQLVKLIDEADSLKTERAIHEDYRLAAMSTEMRYWRWKVTGRVFDTTAWDPMTTDPDVVEPVAVIPLAEYDRLKRLDAAVEDHDVEISNFGAALTDDGRAMVQAAIRAYRSALRRAAKGET